MIADALGAPLRGAVEWRPLKRLLRSVYDHYFYTASGQVRLFRGIYPDFATARAAAPAGRPIGYDNEETAWRVADERHRVFDWDYPMLFWMGRLLPETGRVFDLGGNVGISYYAWRRYLTWPDGLDWLVADVPHVVAAGERLAREEPSIGLRFTTSLDELPRADLMIAAGVLQFLEDPFGSLALPRGLPRHILINKTPLTDRDDAVTLQATGASFCPYHLFNRARFLARFEARGYRLVDSWTTQGMGMRVPFHPVHDIAAFSGCYFVRD